VTAAAFAGLLAGYGIAMPVGAVATYLVALTARTSLRIGACAALGVATADGLYALIAQVGGSALSHTIQPVLLPLRWTSVVVLLALAVRGGVSAFVQHRDRDRDRDRETSASAPTRQPAPMSPARAYLRLCAITMLNPLTVIYFAALVLGAQGKIAPAHPQQVAFVTAAFIASASWQLLLALGGALLGRILTGHRGRLITALGSSILIALLALRLVISVG
jgi:threonine/homoserine/homoserine lactone efflux protein